MIMGINKMSFESNPTRLDISRSKFDLSHDWTGTFSTGKLIPIYMDSDILPGDTISLDLDSVVRSTTPIAPVMDNCFADFYFFFVPHKLTLGRQMMSPAANDSAHSWKAIIGAQDSLLNMPLPAEGASLPTINFGKGSRDEDQNFAKHSLPDYLGLPDFEGNTSGKRVINALEPLAYYCVWNEYFREPNTMNPVTYSISGNTSVLLSGGISNWNGIGNIGLPNSILPVCRFHGYFGSALPWPQRNSTSVTLPLGDLAPLVTLDYTNDFERPVMFKSLSSWTGTRSLELDFGDGGSYGDMKVSNSTHTGTGSLIVGSNLAVDLHNAEAPSINQFRQAIQIQRWYEAAARGGNRLSDLTSAMFGVTPGFGDCDRPEFLGAKRVPIQMQQVNATAGNSSYTEQQLALGSTGAYSLTYDKSSMFTKSFDTWGTLVGLMCIRTQESFHQGLERKYSRRTKFDFYWPQFANLGEQPIKEKEIFMDGTVKDDSVFGYQEAWAEYRYKNNKVVGYARPGASQAYWNYCNDFETAPTLAGYLDASNQVANVDRTLQVSDSTAGFQWQANIHFTCYAVRPMPTYSVPGLMDHH